MHPAEFWAKICAAVALSLFIIVPFVSLFDYMLPQVETLEVPKVIVPVHADKNDPFTARPPDTIAIEAVPDDTPLQESYEEDEVQEILACRGSVCRDQNQLLTDAYPLIKGYHISTQDGHKVGREERIFREVFRLSNENAPTGDVREVAGFTRLESDEEEITFFQVLVESQDGTLTWFECLLNMPCEDENHNELDSTTASLAQTMIRDGYEYHRDLAQRAERDVHGNYVQEAPDLPLTKG